MKVAQENPYPGGGDRQAQLVPAAQRADGAADADAPAGERADGAVSASVSDVGVELGLGRRAHGRKPTGRRADAQSPALRDTHG